MTGKRIETLGGKAPDGRKVRGTIHWVAAAQAIDAEVRLYDRLFTAERPEEVPEGGDYRDALDPESLKTVTAKAERSLSEIGPGQHVQFERTGYFFTDPKDSEVGAPVFNQVVALKGKKPS